MAFDTCTCIYFFEPYRPFIDDRSEVMVIPADYDVTH